MDKEILRSSVRLKFGDGKYPGTRAAVLQEVKGKIPLDELEAVYNCGEGRDWYLTFTKVETAIRLSDETFRSNSGATVRVESLDRRRVRFRVHWFPFHMKGELVEEHMEEYGSQIKLEYETQHHDGVNMKTGTMSGTMVCSESQYQSIPYRAHIHGRLVLITVMGRQTVCLRCGDMGHQRSTCPLKTAKKSYAAAARSDTQGDWQTAGSSHTSKVVEVVAEEMEHVPLSPESEVGAEMGPPQDRREKGQEKEQVPLSPVSEVGVKMGPPQDRRGRGQEQEEETTLSHLQDKRRSGNVSEKEDEEVMDTSKPVKEKSRKRKKATDETVKKKVKDNFNLDDENDNLDLTSDVKPILSIGLIPPSNEVIEIETDNDNGQ